MVTVVATYITAPSSSSSSSYSYTSPLEGPFPSLTLSNCLKKDTHVIDFCKTVDCEVDMELSHSGIVQTIQDIKDSNSCGLDGISAEHLGFLSEAMISVVLVPIVKNKSAGVAKSNYRPIALASTVSNVLEKLIYDRIALYLNTCSNQFGFKAKHSTDMTIGLYALKGSCIKIS